MNEQTYQDRPTLAKWNEMVSSVPKIAAGTYWGNGDTLEIELGFEPRILLIVGGRGSNYDDRAVLAVDKNHMHPNSATPLVSMTETGFTVRKVLVDGSPVTPKTNEMFNYYNYLAIG